MNVQLAASKFVGLLIAGTAFSIGTAGAEPLSLSYAAPPSALSASGLNNPALTDQTEPALNPALRRQVVNYSAKAAAGTVIIDTPHTYLYYVLGNGKAIRYGIGVGREGFTWSGSQTVSNKAEWPDWIPPQEMIARQPYLPRWVSGGEGNPLGARAIYLGNTMYRIHGTNAPETIGHKVSSGCIRMLNEDVIDLYSRVDVGTKVVVLSSHNDAALIAASAPPARVVPVRRYDRSASNIY
jgi:lipoprotein-anchoring transpeptidase ErfK/SrfK